MHQELTSLRTVSKIQIVVSILEITGLFFAIKLSYYKFDFTLLINASASLNPSFATRG